MKKFLCVLLMLALLVPAALAEEARPQVTFADLQHLEWTFSSGVGAWYTTMRIQADGTFTGDFHDSNMGESEEAYPNGTVYGCLFHGQMRLEQAGENGPWTMTVESLELDEGQVPEALEDGIRFVTADPYGLTLGQQMILYAPGTPVEQLPEGFRFWAHIGAFDENLEALPFYGLYSEEDDVGFIGEPAMDAENPDDTTQPLPTVPAANP